MKNQVENMGKQDLNKLSLKKEQENLWEDLGHYLFLSQLSTTGNIVIGICMTIVLTNSEALSRASGVGMTICLGMVACSLAMNTYLVAKYKKTKIALKKSIQENGVLTKDNLIEVENLMGVQK